MKKILLFTFLLFSTFGFLKSQVLCFDSLYRASNQVGSEADIAAIYWNSDGAMDYVVVNSGANNVYVHTRNGGDRGFAPGNLMPIMNLNNPIQVEVADFNLDSYNDIAVLYNSGSNDSVMIILCDGFGGIYSTNKFDVPPSSFLSLIDINVDGFIDIVCAERNDLASSNNIYTFSGNGTGNFVSNQTFNIPGAVINSISIGEFDGTGGPDIFVGSQLTNGPDDTSKVFILRNFTPAFVGTFSFSPQYSTTFATNIYAGLSGIVADDLNNDGFDDMAVSFKQTNYVAIFINNWAMNFFNPSFYSVGNGPISIDCADLDGDSDNDLIYTLYSGGLDEVLLNDGTGAFPNTQVIPSVPNYTKLVLADMDNDGFKDILHCSLDNSNASLGVRAGVTYNNNGAQFFMNSISGTVFCEGAVGQFTPYSLHPGYQNNLTYLWFDSSTNDTLNFSALSTTSINVIITNAQGCQMGAGQLATVNPLPNVNLGADILACNSTASIGVSSETNVVYNWTSNPNGFSSAVPTENVSPVAPTTYILNATNSVTGCAAVDSLMVTLYPVPVLSGIGNSITVCENTQLNLGNYVSAVGGTAPYSINWFSGLNNYTVLNPTHTANVSQTFTVSLMDANGCNAIPGAFFTTVNPSTDTWGHISTPTDLSADLSSGFVYAFKYQPGSAGFDTVDIAGINALGDYAFFSLDSGQYLIKTILDTSFYPLSIPTYNGNAFQWDSSLVHAHGCLLQDTVNIQVLEVPTTIGPGAISGYILEGVNFGNGRYGPGTQGPLLPFVPGGPLKGIDVKLGRNPGGGIQARTMSDSTGYYVFDSLPIGGYKIYVDIPNLPMDSTREIIIAAADSSVQNNYIADSASIYINTNYVGIYTSIKEYENNFSIFPNPAKDKISITFDVENNLDVILELNNALGQVLKTERIKNIKDKFTYTFSISEMKLKSGVYFISVVNGNKKYTQRMLVIE